MVPFWYERQVMTQEHLDKALEALRRNMESGAFDISGAVPEMLSVLDEVIRELALGDK